MLPENQPFRFFPHTILILCLGILLFEGIEWTFAQNSDSFSEADFRFVAQGQKAADSHFWIDDFETDLPKWIDVGGDSTHRLTARNRVKGDAYSGSGFEKLQVQTETEGSAIYLAYPIAPAEVRQDLLIQLCIRANRSGLRLMARVVLPFTKDLKTGRAMNFLIEGGTYSSVNRWQQLRIDELSRQVQQKLAQFKNHSINIQNAYVDRILLNVYAGPGTLNLDVDALEISGAIPVPAEILSKAAVENPLPEPTRPACDSSHSNSMRDFPPVTTENPPPPGSGIQPSVTYDLLSGDASSVPSGASREIPAENSGTDQTSVPISDRTQPSESTQTPKAEQGTSPDSTSDFSLEIQPGTLNPGEIQTFQPKSFQVSMKRNVLMIENKPLFVRAIRHHGESLEFLAAMGFNTVWLEAPPTRLMEAEASLLNIWFICPPPVNLLNPEIEPSQAVLQDRLNGCLLNRVIAWDFGHVPGQNEIPPGPDGKPGDPVDFTRKQTQLMLQIPTTQLPRRPVVVVPGKDLPTYSSIYDVLMLDRNPLNSTMSFISYGLWFREMLNLVPVQQSIFVKIPTQFDPLLRSQWSAMTNLLNSRNGSTMTESIPDSLPLEQIRLLTYNVVMAGTRGILFESTSRLDAKDQETIFRARSLELVNREMLILEQWLSQGERFTTLPSDHRDVAGALLATRHVRILLPLVLTPDAQYVCGAGADRKVSFLVRGLPETYQCWQYSLNGLSPLANRRKAGGVEVELEELPLVSTIVMTQNPVIINSISQRIARHGPRMAELMKELAVMRLENWLQLHGAKELSDRDSMYYKRAKNFLDGAEKAFYAHEYADAFTLGQRAMRPIAYLEHQNWLEGTKQLATPNFQPAAVSFRTFQLQTEWNKFVKTLNPGQNIMPGGNLDDLRLVPKLGWKRFQSRNPYRGVTPRADISEEAAHSGPCGLKLEVLLKDKTHAPITFDTPPVVIQSPAVNVGPPGTVYQVEFWLNIPIPLHNALEGLKITDSNSGEVLAERRMKTNGWQKITFQRVVKDENPVYITFALTGYGTVFIDDVQIYPMQ